MADAPVLIVIDPLAGVPYENARDLRAITRTNSPSEWALAVARNALWLIGGQWRYDLDRGIEYQKILGETPDIRFVEESMRRTLAAYFTVLRLSVKHTGDDLIVTFAARVDKALVTASLSFAEGLKPDPVYVLGYKFTTLGITVHFSQELSPWNVPAPGDFHFTGLVAQPTVTAVSINGAHLLLTTSAPLTELYSKALIYSPSLVPLQSITRNLVGGFRLPLETPGLFLADADGYLVADADGYLLRQ